MTSHIATKNSPAVEVQRKRSSTVVRLESERRHGPLEDSGNGVFPHSMGLSPGNECVVDRTFRQRPGPTEVSKQKRAGIKRKPVVTGFLR